MCERDSVSESELVAVLERSAVAETERDKSGVNDAEAERPAVSEAESDF